MEDSLLIRSNYLCMTSSRCFPQVCCLFCLLLPMMCCVLLHFLFLVHNLVRFARVLMSFHTTQSILDYPRKQISVRLKWTKQLWYESHLIHHASSSSILIFSPRCYSSTPSDQLYLFFHSSAVVLLNHTQISMATN